MTIDRSPNLEKFEGVYRSYYRNYQPIHLSSLFWPEFEDFDPWDAFDVEIRHDPPSSLFVRAYGDTERKIVLREGLFEEGKDFTFEDGVIRRQGWNWGQILVIDNITRGIIFVAGENTEIADDQPPLIPIPVLILDRKLDVYIYRRVNE